MDIVWIVFFIIILVASPFIIKSIIDANVDFEKERQERLKSFLSALSKKGIDVSNVTVVEGQDAWLIFNYSNSICYYGYSLDYVEFSFDEIVSAEIREKKSKPKQSSYSRETLILNNVKTEYTTTIWVYSVLVHFTLSRQDLQYLDVVFFSGKEKDDNKNVEKANSNALFAIDQWKKILSFRKQPQNDSSPDDFLKLVALYEKGMISRDEFEKLKQRMLQ